MFTFPEKLSHPRNSLIREVAEKGRTIPNFISFALGNPAAETIPVELIRSCVEEVFDENPMAVLQYGPMSGDAELEKWIVERVTTAKHAPKEGYKALELVGSGKGLGLMPRTLCAEGDRAFCDAFTFPNGFNSIRNVGAEAVGIAMDTEGMIPEALEAEAKKGKGRFVYLIPNFQNPTGITIPLQRRKDLLEVAEKYDLLIYEDDPYGDIRFEGEEVPTMISLDKDGRVVYAGSFSKTLSAGIRCGYLYGKAEVIQKINLVKSADGQDPLFNPKIIAHTLRRLDFNEHIHTISQVYQRKCHLMMDGLKPIEELGCTMTHPEGGMFLWFDLPEKNRRGESVDVDVISDKMISSGIGIVKSLAFAVNADQPGRGFRLNYSAPTDENIRKGTAMICDILQNEL